MSDAQSILLFLLIFYFLECLKWAPLEALSVVGPFPPGEFWSRQAVLIRLFGAGKSVYLAPIVPGLRLQLISWMHGEAAHQRSEVRTVEAVRTQVAQLKNDTRWLRSCSLLLFGVYFAYLPTVYIIFGEGSFLYGGVGFAYLLQAFIAILFRSLHARYFRRELGVRILHTFYCMLLPWSAMRAADEFFTKRSRGWSALAILAAYANSPGIRRQLERYFREAHFLKGSAYRLHTVESMLLGVGMDPATFLTAPRAQTGTLYCPCCQAVYRLPADRCMDCTSVPLIKVESTSDELTSKGI